MDAESKGSSKDQAAPKAASKKNFAVLFVVAIVAAAASASAGAIFGPGLLSWARSGAAVTASPPPPAEKEDALPEEAVTLDPIIVDVARSDGEMHHLKVGIAIETAKKIPEEELKRLLPRARDAAITYLRSLTFEEATTSSKFDGIRSELTERIVKAVGKTRASRVLFTDFVAQ